jgi:hypothetical protein
VDGSLPQGRAEGVASGAVRGAGAADERTAPGHDRPRPGRATPPHAILKQRAFAPLIRMLRLAFFLAKREVAVVELAHWVYGAGGGAAFALLPRDPGGDERDPLTVSRDETLHRAARRMVARRVGAAIVAPPRAESPPGIITDREVLESVGSGQDARWNAWACTCPAG